MEDKGMAGEEKMDGNNGLEKMSAWCELVVLGEESEDGDGKQNNCVCKVWM